MSRSRGLTGKDARRNRLALSARELEVLRLVAAGTTTDAELCEALHISRPTLKNHFSHIYDKLGVSNRTQALVRATLLGLVEIGGTDGTDGTA